MVSHWEHVYLWFYSWELYVTWFNFNKNNWWLLWLSVKNTKTSSCFVVVVLHDLQCVFKCASLFKMMHVCDIVKVLSTGVLTFLCCFSTLTDSCCCWCFCFLTFRLWWTNALMIIEEIFFLSVLSQPVFLPIYCAFIVLLGKNPRGLILQWYGFAVARQITKPNLVVMVLFSPLNGIWHQGI